MGGWGYNHIKFEDCTLCFQRVINALDAPSVIFVWCMEYCF